MDNYSEVHCTHGWAKGEFFQGGWTCHGGSTTTNNPPQLFNIEARNLTVPLLCHRGMIRLCVLEVVDRYAGTGIVSL